MDQELQRSIQTYKEQLNQVERTLEITEDHKEREDLESLKNNLVELIMLTLQTINQDEVHNNFSGQDQSNESSSSKKASLFVSKIKNLEESSRCIEQDANDEDFDKKLQTDELRNMIGKKCSAPHNHSWGSLVYHNAIICGLDESCDYELTKIKNSRFRILFTNPTHREMVPCSYFLEGECKFSAEKCHFSHGELIPFGELREYQEPDFTKLTRNCIVLAKLDDRIWHKGKVIFSNFIEKSCRIRISGQKDEIDSKFEDLFPMFHEDENSSSSDDLEDLDCSNKSNPTEIQNMELIEKVILNEASNQPLGDWEKHTRGIGSKLMKKMGYVFGTGLGSNGKGIVVPVIAQILPPGRSLDHCMELRQMANGDKNLFSMEKKLKKERQKTENRKTYNDFEYKKSDVFSFLNDNILSGNKDMENKNKIYNNEDFRNHSTKKLNIEGVKISDEIRKKEKEIIKIKESMKRHLTDSDIHKRLKMQLNRKNQELENLKKSENKLNKEQVSRKKIDELFVF